MGVNPKGHQTPRSTNDDQGDAIGVEKTSNPPGQNRIMTNNRIMTIRQLADRYDITRRLTAFVGRAFLGWGLGIVLSMTGLAFAWGLFIFSGATERSTFMIMSMAGGGIGAGIGPAASWIRLDRQHLAAILLTLLLCVAGGVIGGLIGYQFGANREYECCAEPRTTPFTHTAIGATIGANVIMYLIIVVTTVARLVRGGRGAVADRP